MRLLSLSLSFLLAGPIHVYASGPVPSFDIEASMRAHMSSVQIPPCVLAETEGRHAADRSVGGVGWFIGSLLLPIVALGSLGANPTPAPSLLAGKSDEEAACFAEGYRQQGRSKVRGRALTGGLIGLAVNIALITAAANE